jgi:hypothetical protein
VPPLRELPNQFVNDLKGATPPPDDDGDATSAEEGKDMVTTNINPSQRPPTPDLVTTGMTHNVPRTSDHEVVEDWWPVPCTTRSGDLALTTEHRPHRMPPNLSMWSLLLSFLDQTLLTTTHLSSSGHHLEPSAGSIP